MGVLVKLDGCKDSPLGYNAGAEVRPEVAPTEFTLEMKMRPAIA
jgi:hypothetical protein